MSQKGKIRLAFIITAPASEVAEGDRLFASHITWMQRTHHRTGEKALLSYDVSKAPELSNPLDISSAPTGKTTFVLAEVYESKAGVEDHYKQAQENWTDFPAMLTWLEKCQITVVSAGTIFSSLW
jgi:quinol monooxygenase YgiN